jgi:hypothetical protein
VIILLGLVVCALAGVALVIAGFSERNSFLGAAGLALVLVALVTGLVLRASCDPGCELGSGSGSLELRVA